MIVLIDNYDSFSYNLYQLIGSFDPDIRVIRNDKISVDELAALKPEALVFSPGPGKPADAGICVKAIQQLSGSIPLLGVCLGHQALYEAFGGNIVPARHLMHGKSSLVNIDTTSPLFEGLLSPLKVARYHSLEADPQTLPDCLQIIATVDEEVMASAHKTHPSFGVQFHPESILTPQGACIIENFIRHARAFNASRLAP
mgnify:FL=1